MAQLYGFPNIHKITLSMRPILLANDTYGYNLAKWLEERLKPVTITDAVAFAVEIRTICVNEYDICLSLLWREITVHLFALRWDWINILVNKALSGDWFNKTYGLASQTTENCLNQ